MTKMSAMPIYVVNLTGATMSITSEIVSSMGDLCPL